MKDDSAPQAPRREQGAGERNKEQGIKRDEQMGESTMKGNITFS